MIYLDDIVYTDPKAYFEAAIHASFTHLCHQNCEYRQLSTYRTISRIDGDMHIYYT